MTGPLPATQRGTVLAGVKAKPFGWPAASLDPGCGRHPANRRRTGLEERPKTKIRQSEVSTLLGDCRLFQQAQGVGQRLGEPSSPTQVVAGSTPRQVQGQRDLIRRPVTAHTDPAGHDGLGVIGAATTELGQHPGLTGGGPPDQPFPADQGVDQQSVAHRRRLGRGGVQVQGQPPGGLPIGPRQRGRLRRHITRPVAGGHHHRIPAGIQHSRGTGQVGQPPVGPRIGRPRPARRTAADIQRIGRVGRLRPGIEAGGGVAERVGQPLVEPRVGRQRPGRRVADVNRFRWVLVVAPGSSQGGPHSRVIQSVWIVVGRATDTPVFEHTFDSSRGV